MSLSLPREYPFEDVATALARRATADVPPQTWLVVRWLFHFIPALVLSLFRSCFFFLDSDFGLSFKSQPTTLNKFIEHRVRKALTGLKPARYAREGFAATLWPYLLFKPPDIHYERYWLRVPAAPGVTTPDLRGADEACALDVAFPSRGRHDLTFLILHGLNGGSDDGYVRDFVKSVTDRGHVAAVLVNRGLMGTPVRGTKSIFSGARTCDVSAAIDVLRQAFAKPVTLVGFSMGAVVAANVACQVSSLLATIAISGSLCTGAVLGPCGDRSRRVWQPPLAANLKASFFVPNLYKLKFDPDPVWRAFSIDEFDRAFVCKVHDMSLEEYYEHTSALGRGDADGFAKFRRLKSPLFVLHSADDPIIPHETNFADAAATASPYVTFLTTDKGGHVGWPTRNARNWQFMSAAALAFATAALDFKNTAPSGGSSEG